MAPREDLATTLDATAAGLLRNLRVAAQIEHLLANEYLYAAFSLKKYPSEFTQFPSGRDAIDAQIERNRRWQAGVLYVARQEMEHLCMVQNMLALLDEDPSLWRPNYPVPAKSYPLGLPFDLTGFNRHTLEVFRYFEKPDSLSLADPYSDAELTSHATSGVVGAAEFVASARRLGAASAAFTSAYGSIEALYENGIRPAFDTLLVTRRIDARNYNRIVNEHFGFNITLKPIVQGKAIDYIDDIVEMILSEGEGVGGVPPPLGSHFLTFQKILDEMAASPPDLVLDSALPVVSNPYLWWDDLPGSTGTLITNEYTREVMILFNEAYLLMSRMLTGFFRDYDIDQTTGIHPPEVNALFQTAFYPIMTMVIRPLGEILARLPAFDDDVPEPGRVPSATAGPSFEFRVPQGPGEGVAKRGLLEPEESWEPYAEELRRLGDVARRLAGRVPPGQEPAGFLGARSLAQRLEYMYQNLARMAVNFERYWTGEMVTVIPSKDFQNLPGMN